jgi:pimeloyl-ACP methyl ester carboxylesterase
MIRFGLSGGWRGLKMKIDLYRISSWLDFFLMRGAVQRKRLARDDGFEMHWIETNQGNIRFYDSQSDKPCVVLSPDGPNVIEHYEELIALLSPHFRVVCFDMPGFGFSAPSKAYDHSLQHGALVIQELLDQLGIARATLALSCANGLYAIRFAHIAPARVERLVLSQTPSLEAMHQWTCRVVPKIFKIPLLGQILNRVLRSKLSNAWYRIALPKSTPRAPFERISNHSLRCGGCFSLAGVVQGLIRESTKPNQLQGIPCTVLWGSKDRSHSPTLPTSVLRDLPDAKLIVLDDCGHFPDLEKPEQLVKVLMDLTYLARST